MGLFSTEYCPICNKELTLTTKTNIKLDGKKLCLTCYDLMDKTKYKNQMTPTEIQDLKSDTKQKRDLLSERRKNFNCTEKYENIWFDDTNRVFGVYEYIIFKKSPENMYMYSYDEILDYELLEDGTSITKGGLGKALVGGAVFGVAGAIAGGASKKTQDICTKLQIKLTTTNKGKPVQFIDFLTQHSKRGGILYNLAYDNAQKALSKLQIIVDEIERNQSTITLSKETKTDSFEEIKKFKELLDEGIISQEEFDAKKKQLLGL